MTAPRRPSRRRARRRRSRAGALLAGAVLFLAAAAPLTCADLDDALAERLARLALECIDREFPNAPAEVLDSVEDVRPPKEIHPAFFGCYDWPSAIQGHWMLVRLLHERPDLGSAASIRQRLDAHFTDAALEKEARYLERPSSRDFERPYGWAWVLRLAAEFDGRSEPREESWRRSLRPLEDAASSRLTEYLPRLTRPVRTGTGTNTAFALAAAIDYARAAQKPGLGKIVAARSDFYFARDRGCPLSYEPSGEDFLSPCLAEADLMRRVLAPRDYARWLRRFLPSLARHKTFPLSPVTATDPADEKLARLEGLNLSRAWMLRGIAEGLPASDSRRAALVKAAAAHEAAGLARVPSGEYAGEDRLAAFAVYLLTRAGN
jgi:hypothetical protein